MLREKLDHFGEFAGRGSIGAEEVLAFVVGGAAALTSIAQDGFVR